MTFYRIGERIHFTVKYIFNSHCSSFQLLRFVFFSIKIENNEFLVSARKSYINRKQMGKEKKIPSSFYCVLNFVSLMKESYFLFQCNYINAGEYNRKYFNFLRS